MNIDNIIFDWSGVLSDDFDCVLSTLNETLEKYDKKPISADYLRENYERNLYDFFRKLGIDDSQDSIQEKYNRNFQGKKPKPMEGVEDVLNSLFLLNKEMKVLSAHPQNFLEKEISDYGFAMFFNSENIFGSVTHKGQYIANKGLNEANVVFVGDTWIDMEAGEKAGIETVGVLTGYNSRDILEEYTDYVINDLYELLPLI